MLRGERDTGNQHQMPLPQTAEDRTATNQDRTVASYTTCSQHLTSFTPNPVGLAHFLKDYPIRRPAASLHQALALLLFPGTLQQCVTEMLKLRCPHSRALLRQGQGRTPGTRGSCPPARPPSLALLPQRERAEAPGCPGGPGVTPPLVRGAPLAVRDWLARTDVSVGLAGHTRAPPWEGAQRLWDPACQGPAAPSGLALGAAALPHPCHIPTEGTCPAPVPAGVWEQQWPPQAWPGPLTRDVDPAPRGQAAKARAGPDPDPTSYGSASFPPAPQKFVLGHQILKNLLQMLSAGPRLRREPSRNANSIGAVRKPAGSHRCPVPTGAACSGPTQAPRHRPSGDLLVDES